MIFFSTLADAKNLLPEHKKWNRTYEAIEASNGLLAGVYYSVGDSLTWMNLPAGFQDKHLQASNRYLRILYVKSGEVTFLHSQTAGCAEIRAYSDLDDKVFLSGDVAEEKLEAGNFVIFEPADATQIQAVNGETLLLRVTVEGFSFPNK